MNQWEAPVSKAACRGLHPHDGFLKNMGTPNPWFSHWKQPIFDDFGVSPFWEPPHGSTHISTGNLLVEWPSDADMSGTASQQGSLDSWWIPLIRWPDR